MVGNIRKWRIKMKRRNLSYLVILFWVISSIIPNFDTSVLASENKEDQLLEWFTTSTETSLYNSDNEEVASIKENVLVLGETTDSSLVMVKSDEQAFFIHGEDLKKTESPIEESEQLSTEADTLSSYTFHANEALTNETFDETYLTFSKDIQLNVIKKGEQIIVPFGGSSLYLPVEKTTQENELEEQTDESTLDTESKEDAAISEEVNESTDTTAPASTSEKETTTESSTSLTSASEEGTEVKETQSVKSNEQEPEGSTSSFNPDTPYFTPKEDVLVYENRDGELIPVGILKEGQAYKRNYGYGRWNEIRFGNTKGFVYQPSTLPVDEMPYKNPDHSANLERTFTTLYDVELYDNTSGSLVPFATIKKGVTYPIVGQAGSWLKVNMGERLGYLHSSHVKLNFTSIDKYFKPEIDNLGVYSNSSGSLKKVAELDWNQAYPIKGISGNWIEVQLTNQTGYVYKGNTAPAYGSQINNQTTATSDQNYFTMIKDATVFDNSSGSLVSFGKLKKDESFYYLGKLGNWYKVNFAGRTGYIHESNTKTPFKSSDRYFEVYEDNVAIYDKSGGYLAKVGFLHKGQTYERMRDFGNWHQIEYGNGVAYIWKASTKPSVSSKINNPNSSNLLNSDVEFLAPENVQIYDNSSGKLVPFATINKDEYYPIIGAAGSWWKVDVDNRIGYVYKGNVIVGPLYEYSRYNMDVSEMVQKQMSVKPQTDLYRNEKSYVHKDYVELDGNTFPTTGTVTTDSLNVREGTSTSSWIVGNVRLGQTLQVISQSGDWYEIKYGPWKNAKQEDVARYINPTNYKQGTAEFFQFLVLSQNAGIRDYEINEKILYDKGILKNQGQAFVDASFKYNINEVYLISHALLETGNGSSELANGILVSKVDGKEVEPRIVYNMYGIGAYDSCPKLCGSETAYKNGWFTPEAAIIGGAEYISNSYVNNEKYAQNTLYKMRWNPALPGTHQYATDIGWATKQVYNIKRLYDLVDRYTLYFDVPQYN
jgi:mannosyl-glycoprotein endo-beta-N-acetylglucosaminidase